MAAQRFVESENCNASNLQIQDALIQFDLLEASLPFPTSLISKEALQLVPFEEDFNQQILKIDSLNEGIYPLKIDYILIGRFSDKEFKAGINLASFTNTPQFQQAIEIGNLNTKRHQMIAHTLRYIAMFEYGEFKQAYKIDDIDSPARDLEKRISKILDKNEALKMEEYFKRYFDLKASQSSVIQAAQELDNQMWEKNIPRVHHFEIQLDYNSSR